MARTMQYSHKNDNISQLSMSSPILSDTFCQVCQNRATGVHYGIYTCGACANFFKRYLVSRTIYECTGVIPDECIIHITQSKKCPSCRLKRCLEVGMQSKLRIQGSVLRDMRCPVCNDHCMGWNYGAYTCNACRQFFSKYAHSPKPYICTGIVPDKCVIDVAQSRRCNSCRLKRCFEIGMKIDAKPMPMPAAPHTSVDFSSVPPTNESVVLPTASLATSESTQDATGGTLPTASQTATVESIQYSIPVPPTYASVVLPTASLATSESSQDTTGDILPTASQTATKQSIQYSIAGHLSNNIEYIKDTEIFAVLQECESMPGPQAAYVPMNYGSIQSRHSLDSQAAHQYYIAQNLGFSQSPTTEGIQDVVAEYCFSNAPLLDFQSLPTPSFLSNPIEVLPPTNALVSDNNALQCNLWQGPVLLPTVSLATNESIQVNAGGIPPTALQPTFVVLQESESTPDPITPHASVGFTSLPATYTVESHNPQ